MNDGYLDVSKSEQDWGIDLITEFDGIDNGQTGP